MVILGLNYYFHDSTACIIKDGKLLAAIEEERLNRDKHTQAFPELAIQRCLKLAGLTFADVDHVAVSIKPTTHWFRKSIYALRNIKSILPFAGHHVVNAYAKQRRFWIWYNNNYDHKQGPKVHFIEHHLTHVAGTFFVSPYKEAALLGIDGSGEWATTWIGHGRDNNIKKFGESFFPHSLGSFYEAVTEFCGFKPNYDEGKTMGLAPMGNSETFIDQVRKIVEIKEDGQVRIDLSYFNYQKIVGKRCSKKFYETFGEPRMPNGEFQQYHMDVAAAFQRVLEEKVLEICDILYKKTKADYLVIAGGVALNSVMNGRIIRESSFKDVYVMPAAGDNGTAIGAAYYLYNGILKNERNYVHDNPYLSTSYSNEEIKAAIDKAKLKAEFVEDIGERAALLLEEGKIIGWFQGTMEIGPRALGSRSILANPAFPQMKDKINAQIKFREAYRPFAPSSTLESYKDYFDLRVEDPFMLKVCNVLLDKQQILPAITHVDGSARLQTVDRDTHPLYHDVITKLGIKTGVPVVLNTSFNIQGEPVVESPFDALRCFYSNGLDALCIGNYVIEK
ncbi:carbamoyltransferase family protein [Sediminicola sp. 1XM1-17]|uniref:carbamoyltransferase family protein n=1 Tax=Sediminicola sp. 1XM1-17 TaxID=3127702 RepID=UPI003078228E